MPANRDKTAPLRNGSVPNRPTKRNFVTDRRPPSAASRPLRRSGPSRSSSCAQTPDSQADRDHTAALRDGRRGVRQTGPGHLRPGGLNAGEQGGGSDVANHVLEGGGEGAGARPPHAATARGGPRVTAPCLDADQPAAGEGRARHVLGLGRRDHRLAAAAQQVGEQLAALGVELRHHVVEQHQRRPRPALGEQRALGEQQREERRPLLALRAVRAQRHALRAEAGARRGAGRAP